MNFIGVYVWVIALTSNVINLTKDDRQVTAGDFFSSLLFPALVRM